MKTINYINKFNFHICYGTRKLEKEDILQQTSYSSEISGDSFLVPKSYEGVDMFISKINNRIKSIRRPSENLINSKLESFRSWLLANSLSETTADTHYKAIRMFFRKTNIIYPTRDTVLKYLGTSYFKNGKSKSHTRNFINAMEWYMRFIGTPETFPKPKKSKRIIREILNEKEIRTMIAQCRDLREKTIISTIAYSGLRIAELCNLKTSDINLSERNILVRSGKGDKDRVVMISRECKEILHQYIIEYKKAFDDYLFRNTANNNRINRERVSKLLKKLAKKADIIKRVFPHLFRHSLATNLLYNGCDIYHIQQQLGHSDIRTTTIYLATDTRRLKDIYDTYCPKYILPYENTSLQTVQTENQLIKSELCKSDITYAWCK